MKLKGLFKNKKNTAIAVLSILLVGTAAGNSGSEADLTKSEEKIEQLTTQIKKQKIEISEAKAALADFQEENESYIELGKKEVEKVEKEAKESLEKTEEEFSQANYDAASEKNRLLSNGKKKEDYLDRLDQAKTSFEKKKEEENLSKAEDAVKKLESEQNRENISDAQEKVNNISDIKEKESLTKRINAVVSSIETREAQEADAAQQAQAAAQAAQDQNNVTVYITATGKRYHMDPHCRGLNNSKSTTPTTLADAQARGLTLCHFE